MELIDNRFRIIKKLYSPEIADIFLTEDIQNNNILVDVKILVVTKYINNILFNMFKSEVIILRNIKHKAIPEYITSNEVDDGEKYFYIAYQHIEGISLNNLMIEKKDYINDNFFNIAIKLFDILEYLESQKVIHKSIYAENIIIDDDFNVYLTGFGAILNKLNSGRTIEPIIGKHDLMPNEQKLGFVTPKTDQYALGVLLINLLAIDMMKGEVIKTITVLRSVLSSITIDENLRLFLKILVNSDSTERFISMKYAFDIFKKLELKEDVLVTNGHNSGNDTEEEYIANQIVKNEQFYAEYKNTEFKKINKSNGGRLFIYLLFFALWGYIIYYFLGIFMTTVEKPKYRYLRHKKNDILLDVYKRDKKKVEKNK